MLNKIKFGGSTSRLIVGETPNLTVRSMSLIRWEPVSWLRVSSFLPRKQRSFYIAYHRIATTGDWLEFFLISAKSDEVSPFLRTTFNDFLRRQITSEALDVISLKDCVSYLDSQFEAVFKEKAEFGLCRIYAERNEITFESIRSEFQVLADRIIEERIEQEIRTVKLQSQSFVLFEGHDLRTLLEQSKKHLESSHYPLKGSAELLVAKSKVESPVVWFHPQFI